MVWDFCLPGGLPQAGRPEEIKSALGAVKHQEVVSR